MNTKPHRKYQPVWEQIKRTNRAVLECHPKAHKTIRTGVIKEKCRDDGFKVINEVEKFFLDIICEEIDDSKCRLIFVLRTRLGLVDPIR